ncbi:MAG: S8 family serine peptidase [Candidatus Glassbacteria bacterium]
MKSKALLPMLCITLYSFAFPAQADESGKSRRFFETEKHVWVYFNDKGEAKGFDQRLMLEQSARDLLPRARARREKSMNGNLVDYRDIPVFDEYIDEIVNLGARLRHRSRWLNAVSVAADLELISRLEKLPFVLRVEPVRRLARSGPRVPRVSEELNMNGRKLPFSLHLASADTAIYGPSFSQLDEIGVVAAHDSGYTGAGVLVGMFDTGYYKTHQSLRNQPIVAEYDFVFGDGETGNEPEDDPYAHFHGTCTWSALGGYAPYALIGPAYGASFFLAKTEDIRSETPVEEDNYVAALEWADSLGASVTSASLAYREFDDPQYDYQWEDMDGNTATITVAVDVAASRGILVVNAMGNEGDAPGSLWTPADADSMLACGAVDEYNNVAGFSSRGPTYDGRTKPEVVARGVDTYCASASSANSYTYAGGTSLSTPLVGGSAAIVFEAHPEWGAMEVRDALMQTADNSQSPDNDRGWGRIDVQAAIYDVSPPIFPVPFDLISPTDGDSTGSDEILFIWNSSRDTDTEDPVSYRLLISNDEEMSDLVHEVDLADTSTLLDAHNILAQNTFYYWTVLAIDSDLRYRMARVTRAFFTGSPTGIDEEDGVPKTWGGLLQNYPNPFNPSTTITFSVRERARVRLDIFDLRGRLVKRLIDTEMTGGVHHVGWDGRDEAGMMLGSGVYLYRLSADDGMVTRKMNLLR